LALRFQTCGNAPGGQVAIGLPSEARMLDEAGSVPEAGQAKAFQFSFGRRLRRLAPG